MFEVTQEAGRMIKDFLAKQKTTQVIRELLQSGCCGGSNLGMALYGPTENDVTFNDTGTTPLRLKRICLRWSIKPIRIDFVDTAGGSGFQLTSSLPTVRECCG